MKFLARLFATYAIEICGRSARCVKGKLATRVLSDLSSLAFENDLQEGEIWIDQVGKVSFSGEIPESIHQRIRNVIHTGGS